MTQTNTQSEQPNSTVSNMARNEFWFKILFVCCGIAEVSGLVSLCILMDWSDQTHLVIFAATMLVYATLALWVWALAVKNRIGEQRILRAIELLLEEKGESN